MNGPTATSTAAEGDRPKAASKLLPLVYEELRVLAAHKLANEAPGQTLQPTALVHEAWLRLLRAEGQLFENRGHFFAAAFQRGGRCALLAAVLLTAGPLSAEDWPMFGRDQTRNPVSPEKGAPVEWDFKTGKNIKWKARLGSLSFCAPVVANGLVWIGTNNEFPRDPGQTNLAGVLMCFRERDGEFLYQHVSPARQGPTYRQTWSGISGSPLIQGDRLWFVNTSAEVICLDIGPLRRGEGKPTEIWKLDLMGDELNVLPRPAVMGGGGLCSIAAYRDLIYVITGNGTDWSGKIVPSPRAPALICLNQDSGKVVWEDESPGAGILFGEWGNPLVVEIGGRGQVIAPQGDGWIRSFDALTGELIWKFDINPKNGKGLASRGFFSTAPVFYRDRIYIALGNYREYGELPGRLVCLDPTKKGDLSLELDDGPGQGKPNPNAGAAWHFDAIKRTMSTVAIHDGLVIAPDFAGIVHCLDSDTGRTNWSQDMRAQVLSSPLIADGKVYVGDEDGICRVLALSKEKRLLAEHVSDGSIDSSPIFANGVLYIVAGETLYAIEEKSGFWPQWRGPDRSNASPETGLLKQWPTNGPPLIWRATGIGLGIHSVSIAGGRVFVVGNREGGEFVFALEERTGEQLWAARVDNSIEENARMRWLTQRSPTVDGDRLYTLTANGELLCLRVADGRKVWQKSYPKDFGAHRPVWGFCDHPLVDGERIICSPFATNAAIAALNKYTGEVVWKTSLDERITAGYAALVRSMAGGVPQFVLFHGAGLAGFASDDGHLLWRYARPNTRIASTYAPIARGDLVLSPNGYGGGLALFKVVRGESGFRAEEVSHQPMNLDAFQDSTAVVADRLYLIERGVPVCVDATTALRIWGDTSTNQVLRAALTWADNHLYIRNARGEVTLAKTSPDGTGENGRFHIPEHEESVGVTSPVVANGRLWLRDNNRLFCYDISESALTPNRPPPGHIVIGLTDREIGVDPDAPRPPRAGVNRAPDAVFVPTPHDIVERMLQEAEVKRTDVLVDLGSGDGRFVIAAAKKIGCKAMGYEIDARLVQQSREAVARENLGTLVSIEHKDIFTVDLSGADVITVFLYPRLMERLIPQFEKLKPGSRIISHQFEMPGMKPDQTFIVESKEDGDNHRIFLWTTPLRKE